MGALVVSPRRRQLTLALALYPRMNIRGPQACGFSAISRVTYAGPSSWSGTAATRTSTSSCARGWPRILAGTSSGFRPTPPNSTPWSCSGATSSTVVSRTSLQTPSTRSEATCAASGGGLADARSY